MEPGTRQLPGDLAVWLIILAELLTFALLFVAYGVTRSLNVELFNESQRTLDATMGVVNTWLLIGGSWCVVRAVQSVAAQRRWPGLSWLVAAQLCGLAFLVLKLSEYGAKADAGIDLETNVFYMFYFLLTGFHFLHVLAAMVFLAFLSYQTWRNPLGAAHLHALETGAAFWHMVDLLWIVLFPLMYIVR
jgi:nitric oxide reductase NorE protein